MNFLFMGLVAIPCICYLWVEYTESTMKYFKDLFLCFSFPRGTFDGFSLLLRNGGKLYVSASGWKMIVDLKKLVQHLRLVVFCGNKIRTLRVWPKKEIRILKECHTLIQRKVSIMGQVGEEHRA